MSPAGRTGETPTLNKDEWLRVIDITIEVNGGRVPIVAGATSNCTAEAVEKARELDRRKGVDAILTASPYYNKPTQEGQYQHFKAIAEAVDKPLVLYNVVRAAPPPTLSPRRWAVWPKFPTSLP